MKLEASILLNSRGRDKKSNHSVSFNKRNTMEDVPIGLQLHRIHGYLKEELRPVTSSEIFQATGVDISNSEEILQSLTGEGSKVLRLPDGTWRWKSKHTIRNRDELIALLKRSPLGIVESELYDTYKGVKSDLDGIKKMEEPMVYVIRDRNKSVLFPREKKLELKIDSSLKEKWLSVSLPDPMTIHQHLVDNGLKENIKGSGGLSIAPIIRKRPAKKRKKRRRSVKLTNVHMLGSGIDLTKDLDVGNSAFDS